MIKRISSIAIFLLSITIVSSQQILKPTLSQQERKKLQRSLLKTTDYTTQIDILLRLAEHHLQKVGTEKADLDSAASFILSAKTINAKVLSTKRSGHILLSESSLVRQRGDTSAGRQLINLAIEQLQQTSDEIYLSLAYLELSRSYDSNKPEQIVAIKDVFKKLFQRVPNFVNPAQLTECMLELMNFYNTQMVGDSYPIKLDFLHLLRRACHAVDDMENEFWVRKEIADIHYQQGQVDLAITELLQIAREQVARSSNRICFTYDLLSGVYFSDANYEKALYYSLETIKNVRTRFDSLHLSGFYQRVASSYTFTGSIHEALDWNIKRLNYVIASKETADVYDIVFSVTADLIRLGRPKEALDMILDINSRYPPTSNILRRTMYLCLANCYAANKQNAMAEKYCEQLIKIDELRRKQKEARGDIAVYQFLVSFYLADRQYGEAEKYFKKLMAESAMQGNTTGILYELRTLFKLDSAKGNYLSAIRHLQGWHLLNDSIYTAKKSRQIEELKISYATEQKDSLINLKEDNIQLLTKQDQLQKSKLQQGAILRNISLAVAALLIIIVILFYNRYRLKQRTNKKLETQQLEIADQNRSLQHLVSEKEWLLKEIHHRVKNNLQIVMSLLNSQSAYIQNDAALTAIHDSQHRVHSISLIHQKLYNSENLSTIDISFYIRELVSYLSDSFDTGQHIHFEMNIPPLEMDVSQAVPLGLILNEAITNSIKYAFPGRSGVISISLSNTSANHYLLIISDNGVGIPTDFKKTGSLGMSLMKGLSEDLDGNISIENNNGTTIKISFVHDLTVKRPDILASLPVMNN